MQLKTLFASVALAGTLHYPVALHAAPTPAEIISTYADITHSTYEDSLKSVKDLQLSINNLLRNPNQSSLDKARSAWIAARVPYQQSEAYRFGNAIVDDWEGRVNSWSLDEGLIDYVDSGYYGAEWGERLADNSVRKVNVMQLHQF